MNAILNKNGMNVRGCSMYVGLFPCNECAKVIIQSGIKEVVYMSDKYSNSFESTASKRLLGMSGVILRQYTPTKKKLTVDFYSLDNNLNWGD